MTRISVVVCLFVSAAFAQPYTSGVFGYHNDNGRTGWNSHETILSASTVSNLTFGKLFSLAVDGQIYAQPLYVAGVKTGTVTRNLAIVATENDSVYAFDADTGVQVWKTSLLLPGSTAVPSTTISASYDEIRPLIGITSTPVIDPATGYLYAVAKSIAGSTVSQRIWGIDIKTGLSWGNQALAATYPGTAVPQVGGKVSYDALKAGQRAALLLLNGIVYVSSASHGDRGPFHGWILGFSAASLMPMFTWNSTPNGASAINGGQGGIWCSGGCMASDGTYMYFATGNGQFNASTGGTEYGDSFVKLGQDGAVHSYFTPSNQAILNTEDIDFGSGGGMLIPGKNLAVVAGKFGTVYLIDTTNPGGFDPGNDNVLDSHPGFQPVLATPAYYNDGLNDWVFYGPEGFTLANNKLIPQFPGKHLGRNISISSNGNAPGIAWGIKWGSNQNTPAILTASTATDYAHQKNLYSSATAPVQGGIYVKFSLPTVYGGKVYVGTATSLDVYGLLH